MKTTILALAVMLFAPVAPVFAQNLVPNGGFEEYDTCPFSFGQWAYVHDWTSPYTQSADYYNRCAGGVVCSVPFNTCGYQEPAEGDAYMGLATYGHDAFYREVIAVQLSEPLQPGVPVFLSMKTSPGGFGSWDGNSARWKAKGPDMRFFGSLPTDLELDAALQSQQVALASQGVLGDTANWTTVSGQYFPDSAYEWLVIANFFPDSSTMPEPLDTVGILNAAYAFVDQVCVSYQPAFCGGWNGLTIGMPEVLRIQNLGATVYLRMGSASTEDYDIDVFDSEGRSVIHDRWPKGQPDFSIDLASVPDGIFTLVCAAQHHVLAPAKLVHVTP